MHCSDRRSFLRAGAGALAGFTSVPLLGSLAGCAQTPAQPGAAGARVPVRNLPVAQLTGRVSVISEVPGNLVMLAADDGLLLVDSGSPTLAASVQKTLAGARVATLINTHYHADQSGGNALFGAAGSRIAAQTITKQWLAADYWSPAEDRWIKAPPKEAVPTVTFRDKHELTAGGERVECGYLLEAHTRGDCYVYLRDSNVLAVGDVASPLRDPVHDWFAGGWLGGRVDALDDLLELANEQTRIVPAYGPVMTRAELQAERDWMAKVYDVTGNMTAKGNSAQDMYDQKVHEQFERKLQDPLRFFYDLAKGYQAHYTNVGANVV